ncbi:hypothetical protein [Micromonospora pisi]|uniref:hypothetical protein n=1 Tax=Micromonospora pisi TaxID=589240 RepID=UPI000EB21E8E|nr:hypothetical protein [Micromonospora pisi]
MADPPTPSVRPPRRCKWRSITPLAPLYASSVDGTWSLSMRDTVGGTGGSPRAFSQHFTRYEA